MKVSYSKRTPRAMRTDRYSIRLFSVTALLLFCVAVQAAPEVTSTSGNFTNGEQVVIRGLNFGFKVTAAPVIWDDFEGGTDGLVLEDQPAQIGRWERGVGSDNVFYSTANPRTGKLSSHHDFVKNFNASLAKNMTVKRLYMDPAPVTPASS